MRNFSGKTRKTLGSVAVVASLALAAPLVMTGTAHAAVKVVVSGTVSCARFADSSPVTLTATPTKGVGDTDEFRAEDATEPYSVTLTGIPKNGTQTTFKITCVDSDNDQNSYSKTFKVVKPANGPLIHNFK